MRQIILGSIKNSPIITHNIARAFIQAREFLYNLNIDLDIDYLFFGQTEVDWTYGLEYERHSSFIEFIIQTSQPPTLTNLTAIIIKSSVEQYLVKTRQTDFGNRFLFDLYRMGCSTCLAKKAVPDWSTPDIQPLLKQVSAHAKQSLRSQTTDDYWFSATDRHPHDFLIWWFGLTIIETIKIQQLSQVLNISEEILAKHLQLCIDNA